MATESLDLKALVTSPTPSTTPPTAGTKSPDNVSNEPDKVVIEKGIKTSELITKDSKNIPARELIQYIYEMEVFYIRPDNVKVDLTHFINKFAYSMDFDTWVMPVITSVLTVTDEIVNDIKKYFNTMKFYISTSRKIRDKAKEGQYIKSEKILDKVEMQLVDPVFDVSIQDTKPEHKGFPRRTIKLEFVLKRDTTMNATVQSKVFNKVTVLDIIHYLLDNAKKEQEAAGEPNTVPIRVAITPPDNNVEYEQIILDPGTLTDNLLQLQQKYGVYKTGIRTYFNSNNVYKDEKTGELKHERVITVTDKGGTAPSDISINKVLVEVVETGHYYNNEYPNGSILDEAQGTIVCRTINPYIIEKKNSSRLLSGDSIRVVGSSQSTHASSVCETKEDPFSKQRTYWNNNDNPFTITELQDSVKEKDTVIILKVDNVDILSFNANLEYTLKFYNSDDEAYSGVYRLTNTRFEFSFNTPKNKTMVPIAGLFRFSNIPKLQVEGVQQEKTTYTDKLANLDASNTDLKKYDFSDSASPPVKNQTKNPLGPFILAFPGKEDNNGVILPKAIGPDFKMSKHIEFKDIYITKDNTDVKKAYQMCDSFKYFIAAQIFSKRILDPVCDKWGKFRGGGGKPNSFFRYDVPKGGSTTSSHLLALAVDAQWTGPGDALTEAFFWIVQNRDILGFDQVILEGNGSQWRWIHLGLQINGSNRKQCLIAKNYLASHPYRSVNIAKFTSPNLANFNNVGSIL